MPTSNRQATNSLTGFPMADALRIHQLVPRSYSNGPGCRAVVWVQGCTLHCPGCFNQDAQSSEGGELMSAQELLNWLTRLEGIEGATFSGGEPLQQLPALLPLLKLIRQTTDLSVLLFSGYEAEELSGMANACDLRELCDILILGRYRRELRLAQGLLGSSNQHIEFCTGRYTKQDLKGPVAEVIIGTDGTVTFSGIDPMVAM